MEMKINWRRHLELSLKEMALRRVVINLWNETDVLVSIENFQVVPSNRTNKTEEHRWKETVESKVREKVPELDLPESLKRQIMDLVGPVGLDTFKWKLHFERILFDDSQNYLDMSVLEQIIRTSDGRIDYRRTTEELLRLELFDDVKSYRLACDYCLVDYITVLWEKLPRELHSLFYSEHSFLLRDYQLEFCWPFILKGEEYKLDNILLDANHNEGFYQYALAYSALGGNISATDYFFQKIPLEERDDVLLKNCKTLIRIIQYYGLGHSIPIETISNVISYLLSKMSSEQQMQVLRQYPCRVLNSFLHWPWQDLFLAIADVIWTFLPEKEYSVLICFITCHFEINPSKYNANFFQEFFLRCPDSFKKTLVNRFFFDFFSLFVKAEDRETIKLVFSILDLEDRINVVTDFKFFKHLDDLIMTEKSYLIKFYLQAAALPIEKMKELKDFYSKLLRVMPSRDSGQKRHKWSGEFLELINGNNTEPIKRSSEGEALIKTKKLRNKRKK